MPCDYTYIDTRAGGDVYKSFAPRDRLLQRAEDEIDSVTRARTAKRIKRARSLWMEHFAYAVDSKYLHK